MNGLFKRYWWLAWVLSGLCFCVSFIFSNVWFFSLFGFVLLLFAIKKTHRVKEVLLGGLCVGVLKAFGAVASIWYVYPLNWLGLNESFGQVILIGLYWVGTSFLLGLGTLSVVYVIWVLHQKYGSLVFLLIPIIWVAGEVLGSFIFSLVLAGPGSYANAYFSFGYIGYLFAHIALLHPVALLGGVYGLSALGAIVGSLLYGLFFEKDFRRKLGLVSFAIVCVFFLLYIFSSPQKIQILDKKIIAIDTSFSSHMMQQSGSYDLKKSEILNATLSAVQFNPDIILLPEDSRLTRAFSSPEETLFFLKEKLGTTSLLIVDSARVTDERGETVLRAFYYDLDKDAVYQTDKQYLVPQGEFIPHAIAGLLRISGRDSVLDRMNKNQSYRSGLKNTYDAFPDDIPGMLFCYESVSPWGVKKITEERSSPLVFHIASHSWFHEPVIFWEQLDAMLRLQAIWNNKIIVQAGNMVAGKSYLPDGTIVRGKILIERNYWKLIEYNF